MAPNILVVDDDPTILSMLDDVLTLQGYTVALRADPIVDLAEVGTIAPDLIMVDMLIGRQPLGAQLLGRLVSHPATTHIPLIACTGSPHAMELTAGFLSELHIPLLRKPFAIADLLHTISQVLATVGKAPMRTSS